MPRGTAAAALGVLALFGSSGCITVTVYQPLVSLQRPTVVDPRVANFQGDRFLVRCVPGDAMGRADTALLCHKIAALLQHQGATVDTDVPTGRGASFTPEVRPDLVIELQSRNLYAENNWLLTYASVLTFTIIPAMSEQDFACDVAIHDANGFLLASDSLQARFVNYLGIGIWAVNAALDVAVRPEDERVTGDSAKKAFSKDYYRQLSQLVLDAKMRAAVLRGFSARPERK